MKPEIQQIADYFLNREYELGRQLCKSVDISLEEMAEYLLEMYVPKKWNRHLPINSISSHSYKRGKKFSGEFVEIGCKMGQFYTFLEFVNNKIIRFYFAYSSAFNKNHSNIKNILASSFRFAIEDVDRSFYKTFIFHYNETWNNSKIEILNHITTQE